MPTEGIARVLTFVLIFFGAAGGWIASRDAQASVELDRRYALGTVGYLRAWDNVDGLFADYVADAYRDYFSRSSRFTVQDLGRADAILEASKTSYKKLIEDNEILAQLARSTRSQTLIRTEVRKDGAQYRFEISWLLAPSMETLAKDTLVLTDPRDGTGFSGLDLKGQIEKTLDNVIHAVPFYGQVNGRDESKVTLNMGSDTGIEPGDTLQIATVDQVKRHPLLNQIVEWEFAKTGRVVVDQVDEKLSFGHIVSEEPSQQISREQKVVAIVKKPASQPEVAHEGSEKGEPQEPEGPPVYGWASGGLNLGGFSRNYSSLDNTVGENGSGFLYGVTGQGQLWFTRNWFADFGLSYGSWGYSQLDTTPASSGQSKSLGGSSLTSFSLDAGYAFLLHDDVMGPKGWVKLGYRSMSYSLPDSSADNVAAINFKSLFIGIGGDVPIRDGFGALLDLDFGLLKGLSEDGNLSGNPTSQSDVSFSLGGYYRFTPRITLRATVDLDADSADFDSGRSLSQKVITFSPALVYYF